ncbi:uncharacterized protein F4812DRAFT_470194 [Daldinia caldariorum]|uniref:uncharacterized protein n=1 Tax=Daldinia caldariorum TaxID=326644 RepID=UPI00200839D7|nr:uncharacterized protein F4812DRAFT_470194 [Daldinia caldariorum]KAI1469061.1 hypothetical protein F4812DRAFT_470194 [Daldinia caldariorum]
MKGGASKTYAEPMNITDNPANSYRATLSAIILALYKVLELHKELKIRSQLNVSIATDSLSAQHCMIHSINCYSANCWRNNRGEPVANWDLLARIVELEVGVKSLGRLTYNYIPEQFNTVARRASSKALDEYYLNASRVSISSLTQPISRGSMFEEEEDYDDDEEDEEDEGDEGECHGTVLISEDGIINPLS